MAGNPAPKLYKYRSLGTGKEARYAFSLIRDNAAHFASPRQFNDPYECRFQHFPASCETYVRFGAPLLRQTDPNLSDMDVRVEAGDGYYALTAEQHAEWENRNYDKVQARIDETGVFCLSEVDSDILMWSHYADGHQGICVEFNYSVMPREFVGAGVMPVRYQHEFATLDLYDQDELAIVRPRFFIKAAHWQYEKEWRSIRSKGIGIETVPEWIISAVILGCRIRQAHKEEVLLLAANHRPALQVYQARQIPNQYALNIEPLENSRPGNLRNLRNLWIINSS